MLSVRNLEKEYQIFKNKKEKVLSNINVDFMPGFNVILGESGSGKSTLLNIISGLDSNYQGEIIFNNNNLKDINLDTYRAKKIGFVFQSFNLVSHLSILDNVKSSMYLDRNISKSQRDMYSKNILTKLGLGKYLNKKPNQLSGGQKQRVAIARAIANDPELIIADEPTGALDSKTSIEVISILKELSQMGKTLIVVTHDQNLTKFADQVIEIKDGYIKNIWSNNNIINENINTNTNENLKKSKGISFIANSKLSFKNFWERKFRNILVSLGTSIGIIGILLSLGLGEGINKGINNIFSGLLSPNSISVYKKQDKGGPPRTNLKKEEIKLIKDFFDKEDVKEVYEEHTLESIAIKFDGKDLIKKQEKSQTQDAGINIILQEENRNEEKMSSFNKEEETLLSGSRLYNDKDGIIISESTAQTIYAIKNNKKEPAKIKVNEIKKLLNKEITFSIISKEGKPKEVKEKITGIMKDAGFSTITYASKKTFNKIIDKTNSEYQTLSVTGFTEKPEDVKKIVDKYAQNSEVKLNSKEKQIQNQFSVVSATSILDQITTFTSTISYILAFVAGLSLIVAIVMISIVLYIGVIERTKEIGVLRALGYKKSNIRSSFLIEALLIIIFANLIGLIIAYVIAISINPIIEKIITLKDSISIRWQQVLIVFSITSFIGLLAGIYPASKAAKLDPVESLRRE